MLSEKERSLLHLVAALLALVFLYIVAFVEIFTRTDGATWWMPVAQLFFILIGIQWGLIKVPANAHAMQAYIITISCTCFLPVLFIKSFGLVSFPLFVGWVMSFVGQLMSLLKKIHAEK